MQTQVAKMICRGTYTVIYDDRPDYAQYKIFKNWKADGRQHRRLVAKYNTLASCMTALAEVARREVI